MKKIAIFAISVTGLSFVLAYAQPASNSSTMPSTNQTGYYVWVPQTNSLPKFDLNFPGGTPEQLVQAIEKVTHDKLNVMIPQEYADLKLPPVSVRNVTMAQLFAALESNSVHDELIEWQNFANSPKGDSFSAPTQLQRRQLSYGFRTVGVPDTNSIWYFYCDQLMNIKNHQKICHFYQLAPYLEAGYKVEDITSAIRAGWKALGITSPPKIMYQKETKLLIVVGEANKVVLAGDVLDQLLKGKPAGKSAGK